MPSAKPTTRLATKYKPLLRHHGDNPAPTVDPILDSPLGRQYYGIMGAARQPTRPEVDSGSAHAEDAQTEVLIDAIWERVLARNGDNKTYQALRGERPSRESAKLLHQNPNSSPMSVRELAIEYQRRLDDAIKASEPPLILDIKDTTDELQLQLHGKKVDAIEDDGYVDDDDRHAHETAGQIGKQLFPPVIRSITPTPRGPSSIPLPIPVSQNIVDTQMKANHSYYSPSVDVSALVVDKRRFPTTSSSSRVSTSPLMPSADSGAQSFPPAPYRRTILMSPLQQIPADSKGHLTMPEERVSVSPLTPEQDSPSEGEGGNNRAVGESDAPPLPHREEFGEAETSSLFSPDRGSGVQTDTIIVDRRPPLHPFTFAPTQIPTTTQLHNVDADEDDGDAILAKVCGMLGVASIRDL